MEEQVSEKIIIEKEKDNDDETLGGEDDENGDDVAQEVDKNAKEEEDDATEEEDDEQLEDSEDGLESITHAAIEGDQDALSIPEFTMMTVLNYDAKPSKEEMNKVMDNDEAFYGKVCQSSRKGVEFASIEELNDKRMELFTKKSVVDIFSGMMDPS
uniref:Acidic leucine-rich nuclear phosphoprotein 32 family member B-like n=1 Tax=Nicotiana tabacum TaxID=4097 RepID=A0A1S4BL43_TOBAC|nr:PREDICTED: acidic leucine-rich nuclear phosphoprotein 32 family member B-like [Nicotiana tabacum]